MDEHQHQLDLSGKLLFLFELLKQTEQLNEKVLVFSQSLLTLDLIEVFLSEPQFGDWEPGVDYYRLDGSTSASARSANMSEFNNCGNDRYAKTGISWGCSWVSNAIMDKIASCLHVQSNCADKLNKKARNHGTRMSSQS